MRYLGGLAVTVAVAVFVLVKMLALPLLGSGVHFAGNRTWEGADLQDDGLCRPPDLHFVHAEVLDAGLLQEVEELHGFRHCLADELL